MPSSVIYIMTQPWLIRLVHLGYLINLELRLRASRIKDGETSNVWTQKPLAVAVKLCGLQNIKSWETEWERIWGLHQSILE